MNKTIEKLNLKKGQILLLEKAKKNLIPEKIHKEMEDVMEGRVPNPASQIFRPIHIVDDTWDGFTEGKTITIEINPEDRGNKLDAYFMKRFGKRFGLIYSMYLQLYGTLTKRQAGQGLRRLVEKGCWNEEKFIQEKKS